MVSGGVGYSMLSAFVLSLGMNIQRYALHPEFEPESFKCCGYVCCTLSKDKVWGIGFSVYIFANMIYTMGLSYAPLSLMSAIFASVLVFNWLWAGIVFQNRFERSQLGGNVIILTGVVICACYATDKEETYGVEQIQDLLINPQGWGFLLAMLALFSFLYSVVYTFERSNPDFRKSPPNTPVKCVKGDLEESTSKDDDIRPTLKSPPVYNRPPSKSFHEDDGDDTPRIRVGTMVICYSNILAIFESIGQMCLKCGVNLAVNVMSGADDYTYVVFWGIFIVGALCFAAILVWLRKTYSRFETTECLPIQYGSVTIFSLSGGLIFFEEHDGMSQKSILMVTIGTLFLITGIFVSSGSSNDEEDKYEDDFADFDLDPAQPNMRVVPRADPQCAYCRVDHLRCPVHGPPSPKKRKKETQLLGSPSKDSPSALDEHFDERRPGASPMRSPRSLAMDSSPHATLSGKREATRAVTTPAANGT
jgi:hypothetical protein